MFDPSNQSDVLVKLEVDNHNYKLHIIYWLCIGYACRADKNPYQHDSRADSQCLDNVSISSTAYRLSAFLDETVHRFKRQQRRMSNGL